MDETRKIAQLIIKNGREQEGTGLLSWEESAGHLIEQVAINREWIPIDKQEPEEREYVIVTNGEDVFEARIDRFDPQYMNQKTWYIRGAPFRGGNWGSSLEESAITHWMPKPNPPKNIN